MDLKTYMFFNKITNVEMAKRLECSRPTISNAKRGIKISKRLAKDIEQITGGKVKYWEVLGEGESEETKYIKNLLLEQAI